MWDDLLTKPVHWRSSVKVHDEWDLPRSREVDIDVEWVCRTDLVPERRGSEKCILPVTTDLSTDVCKVRYGVGCEGADVDEDLGWEFVDRCERVSHRSEDTGSFNQATFSADNLRRRVS